MESFGIPDLKNTCGCTTCACSVNRQPGYRLWIIEIDIQIRTPDSEIHNTQANLIKKKQNNHNRYAARQGEREARGEAGAAAGRCCLPASSD